jgi:16S rRNA (cytosine1402-N4)-methyltransferase
MSRDPAEAHLAGGETAASESARHRPVMLAEILAALSPRDGGLYVDGTFGAGGYTRALLDAARCTVIGIDRDPAAIEAGADLGARSGGRLHLIEGRFGAMRELLAARGIEAADGIAFDFGVSSMQLDQAERGFSFRFDGPLDMRMESHGPTAADLVNTLGEDELAEILRTLGEERRARAVARAIVMHRPFTRTLQLAEIVRRAVRHGRARAIETVDPATRTFQALRIGVNDELGEIDSGLVAAEALLKPGGRLAVVSFHSLEDRRVKTFLRQRAGTAGQPSRHAPAPSEVPAPSFRLLSREAMRPGAAELAGNPRARSARLRAAERTRAPAWGWDRRQAA